MKRIRDLGFRAISAIGSKQERKEPRRHENTEKKRGSEKGVRSETRGMARFGFRFLPHHSQCSPCGRGYLLPLAE